MLRLTTALPSTTCMDSEPAPHAHKNGRCRTFSVCAMSNVYGTPTNHRPHSGQTAPSRPTQTNAARRAGDAANPNGDRGGVVLKVWSSEVRTARVLTHTHTHDIADSSWCVILQVPRHAKPMDAKGRVAARQAGACTCRRMRRGLPARLGRSRFSSGRLMSSSSNTVPGRASRRMCRMSCTRAATCAARRLR